MNPRETTSLCLTPFGSALPPLRRFWLAVPHFFFSRAGNLVAMTISTWDGDMLRLWVCLTELAIHGVMIQPIINTCICMYVYMYIYIYMLNGWFKPIKMVIWAFKQYILRMRWGWWVSFNVILICIYIHTIYKYIIIYTCMYGLVVKQGPQKCHWDHHTP